MTGFRGFAACVAGVTSLVVTACSHDGSGRRPSDADVALRDAQAKAAREHLANDDETERFIADFAETLTARKAFIALLADTRARGGCPEQLALLTRLESAITDTVGRTLVAEIAVKRAELSFGECRDDAAVVAAAQHAEIVAAKTNWLDDAQWILGRAAERTGEVDVALAAYTRIIDTRSDAWFFGSNDSLFLDDAWLAKGLLLEKLGRTKDATSTLRDLIKARPTSRLRDDAERALQRMNTS